MNYDRIREAIQIHLNRVDNEGWVVVQYVVAIGLERINSDGKVESQAWILAPDDQPEWQTDGLLDGAIQLRSTADTESE
jgi:hypothetical protein